AGVGAPAPAAEPLAVEEMGPGELDTDAGSAEPVDRLPVEALGVLAVAQQGSRAGLDPQRPVGAAGASRLREPLEGVGRAGGLPAPGGRFDELDQPPGGRQLLGVLAGLPGRV